ncbi:MAG: hypothetical protein AMJ65_06450 [Phycisphaerae bacterium SG8_4]|nr:MAG: hypothetical protein AMJ65_06450 [Phycisphaerae bacterium SG8_4]
MVTMTALLLADFATPEKIGVNPQSMLWLLPLVASIAVVYKATKVQKITAFNFLKETVILFGSIVIFMIITALVLCASAWFITE